MPRFPLVSTARLALVALCLAGVTAACSSSGSPARRPSAASGASTADPPAVSTPAAVPPCPASLRTAFAAGARTASVLVSDQSSAPQYLDCRYRASAPVAGACSAATVSINEEPQAYKDFQRWEVESTQTAGQGMEPTNAPSAVRSGIGLSSDWIVTKLNFEAAIENRWVAIFLTCPPPNDSRLAFAEQLARAAMSS